jgi:hypothetical protein
MSNRAIFRFIQKGGNAMPICEYCNKPLAVEDNLNGLGVVHNNCLTNEPLLRDICCPKIKDAVWATNLAYYLVRLEKLGYQKVAQRFATALFKVVIHSASDGGFSIITSDGAFQGHKFDASMKPEIWASLKAKYAGCLACSKKGSFLIPEKE